MKVSDETYARLLDLLVEHVANSSGETRGTVTVELNGWTWAFDVAVDELWSEPYEVNYDVMYGRGETWADHLGYDLRDCTLECITDGNGEDITEEVEFDETYFVNELDRKIWNM